jgi:hypothetical protein
MIALKQILVADIERNVEAAVQRDLDSTIARLSRFLIGSVAERVVRSAPCPVLTVRAHERDFVELGEDQVSQRALIESSLSNHL